MNEQHNDCDVPNAAEETLSAAADELAVSDTASTAATRTAAIHFYTQLLGSPKAEGPFSIDFKEAGLFERIPVSDIMVSLVAQNLVEKKPDGTYKIKPAN